MINLICVAVSGSMFGACASRGFVFCFFIFNFVAMLINLVVVMEKL